MAKIDFRVNEGAPRLTNRAAMQAAFSELPVGGYTLEIIKRSTYRGRYKYYFGYLLPEIINQIGFRVIDTATGEIRTGTVDELHGMFKCQYNPVSVQNPLNGQWSVTGASTTIMPDGDFINTYEEQIACEAANRGAELLSRNEWVNLKSSQNE